MYESTQQNKDSLTQIIDFSGESISNQENLLKESIEELEKKYESVLNNPQKKSIETSSVAIQLGLKYMETGDYDKAVQVMENIKNRVLYNKKVTHTVF
ncbi:MAG: hypothetical protein OEZ22_11790 [Spirochaetia bacterium]|nr:hypothetical protein [Spirochaetia bacterium]